MSLPQILRRAVALGTLLVVCGNALAANDPRPVVGPGATKDEVINAYGWPNGQSQSGTKEILSYAQGEVILENGRVERVNFSPDVPWQAPRPRPAPATSTTRKVPEAPTDFWLTSFPDALREAQKRQSRILALFTGSDWSPASRQFHEQVEFHPDFVNAFAGDFVFLKLDFPRGSPVPAKISDENLQLRDRYQVTTYPALLVLSPTGQLMDRIDLTKPQAADSFRGKVVAAVREADEATRLSTEPPLSTAAPAEPAAAPAVAAATASVPAPSATVSTAPAGPPPSPPSLRQAGWLIGLALAAGVGIVGFVLWKLWHPEQPKQGTSLAEMTERIDAAAGGLPSGAEMSLWSKSKLVVITAGLAEFDNYTSHIRPADGDVNIELRKRGDVNPRVLVFCAPGSEGVIPAKQVRELYGSLAAEGVDVGWFVSPAGFTAEAREYAASHRIVLVTAEGLQHLMREVPPVSLPELLARE